MYRTLFIAKAAIAYAFQQVATSDIGVVSEYLSREQQLKGLALEYTHINDLVPDDVPFAISDADLKAAMKGEL